MASDTSYFAEKFFTQIFPLIPPIVLLDRRNRFKCDAILLVAEDVNGLRSIMRTLPRFPNHRLWCFLNNNTLDEIEQIFKNNLKDFGDADFIIVHNGEYNHVLRIQQPERVLEKIEFPRKGQEWPVIVNFIKTFKGKEVRYSTASCDVHSRQLEDGTFWGLDWNVFKEITEGMELKPKFVPLSNLAYSMDTTGKFFNGTWEGGILGNMAHGTADVGFCGFVFEINKFRGRIKMGNPLRDTCLMYAVPRPKPNLDNWMVVFASFTPTVHLISGLSILVFATTIRSVANIGIFQSSIVPAYRSLGYCLNVAWGVAVQGNFPNPCKMGSLRPFMFLWACQSLLIASSFSSHLVSNFARPPYNPKPSTIEELVTFGYESPQSIEDQFPLETIINPEEPFTRQWLNSRIFTVSSNDQMINILDNKPNQAILGFRYARDVFIPFAKQMIPASVMDKYETMDKCIAMISEGFAFRLGSPLARPFNEYVLNLYQSGILAKLTKDVLAESVVVYPATMQVTRSQQNPTDIKPLSIFHLKGVFVALIFGYLTSTLTLIVEMIYNVELNKHKSLDQKKSFN